MLRYLQMNPKIEANIFALGLTTIFILGSVTLVVAMVAGIWLAFQAILLVLTSVIECASTIGALYSGADPLVKLLLLCALVYVASKVARRVKAWRAK